MLVKTYRFDQAVNVDISKMMNELNHTIEGKGKSTKRIERFADVMAKRIGLGEMPLIPELLTELQQEILGDKSIIQQYGVRQSPLFVS